MYDSLPNLVDGGVTIDVDPRFGPDHAEHTIHTISDVRTFGTLAQSNDIYPGITLITIVGIVAQP